MAAPGDIRRSDTARDDHVTPLWVVRGMAEYLSIGSYSLDVAAEAANARTTHFLTGPCTRQSGCECGLCSPWVSWSWCNPPYKRGSGSRIEQWTQKAVAEFHRGNYSTLLVPASTGTKWFATAQAFASLTIFLTGRIEFELPAGAPPRHNTGNTVDSAFLVYGYPFGPHWKYANRVTWLERSTLERLGNPVAEEPVVRILNERGV